MKYVVLSFDDGYKDFHTRALTVLTKYNLPAVLNVISDNAKTNQPDYVSWEDMQECQQNGIEIANHSAKHNNELENIIRGAKDIQQYLGITEKIGFASPHSSICRKNFATYQSLLESDHTAYIRSGNQVSRDGYFHALLYLIYRHTASKTIFYWYNRRNILSLNKPPVDFFSGITCSSENTMEQLAYLIEKMPEDSACIIIFHRISEKGDAAHKGDKWSNTVEELDFLCDYLSKNEKVAVITQKQLCEVIAHSQAH